MTKIGVLLINLGTPAGSDTRSVRRYLKEFLGDPRVVDLPWWLRQLILKGLILPFRTPKTAHAYQTIWDKDKGSPLLFHSQNLAHALQKELGENYQVALGMRYGEPSISKALDDLFQASCQKIVILPLFPQYSSAASGSAIEKVMSLVKSKWQIPNLSVQKSFHNDLAYIQAKSEIIRPFLSEKIDKVLFSYHSLPIRHIYKSKACLGTCLSVQHRCPIENKHCYRAQCYETSDLIARQLGLSLQDYQVAFQSRVGRNAWVGPDLQNMMKKLIQEGTRNLLMVCPSFVADCLETLEEIGIRGKETWLALGGTEFKLVPSLNADPRWVTALKTYIHPDLAI